MMVINWKLGLVLLLITIIMLLFSWKQNARMEETFTDNRKKIAGINASLQNSLGGIRVVQSFANEDLEARKFDSSNQAYLRSKRTTIMRWLHTILGTISFRECFMLRFCWRVDIWQ